MTTTITEILLSAIWWRGLRRLHCVRLTGIGRVPAGAFYVTDNPEGPRWMAFYWRVAPRDVRSA